MEKIILNDVTRCDMDETELEFIVRSHKVTGLFPITPKCRIYHSIRNANQELKYREKGGKTAQKSREYKYVANKSHNTLLRCLRQ